MPSVPLSLEKGNNHLTFVKKTKKKESVLYYPMEEFAEIFFPAAKAVTEQIVNGDFD